MADQTLADLTEQLKQAVRDRAALEKRSLLLEVERQRLTKRATELRQQIQSLR